MTFAMVAACCCRRFRCWLRRRNTRHATKAKRKNKTIPMMTPHVAAVLRCRDASCGRGASAFSAVIEGVGTAVEVVGSSSPSSSPSSSVGSVFRGAVMVRLSYRVHSKRTEERRTRIDGATLIRDCIPVQIGKRKALVSPRSSEKHEHPVAPHLIERNSAMTFPLGFSAKVGPTNIRLSVCSRVGSNPSLASHGKRQILPDPPVGMPVTSQLQRLMVVLYTPSTLMLRRPCHPQATVPYT